MLGLAIQVGGVGGIVLGVIALGSGENAVRAEVDQPCAELSASLGQAVGEIGVDAAHQSLVAGRVVLFDEPYTIDYCVRLHLDKRLVNGFVARDVVHLDRLGRGKKLVCGKLGNRTTKRDPNLVLGGEAAPKFMSQHPAAAEDEQPQGWASFPCRAWIPRTSLTATRLNACFGLRLMRSKSVSSSSHNRQPGKLCFGPAM